MLHVGTNGMTMRHTKGISRVVIPGARSTETTRVAAKEVWALKKRWEKLRCDVEFSPCSYRAWNWKGKMSNLRVVIKKDV